MNNTSAEADRTYVALDSETLPGSRKLDGFRETYSTSVMACEIDSLEHGPFWAKMESRDLGEITVASVAGSPMRCRTTVGDSLKNEPGLMLDTISVGTLSIRQAGRDTIQNPGDTHLCHTQMPFLCVHASSYSSRSVVIPERVLVSSIGDIERLAGMVIPPNSPEIRLLSSYLNSIDLSHALDKPLQAMFSRHVIDLGIAAIARHFRREDPTEGRGVRAARLREVRRIIDEQLAQPMLNAVRVGRQLGVSDRYIQKLIEESGTTFSALVMEKRLQRAYRDLAEDRRPDLGVREIAWESGFSDASHFTRAFRRRFGETPSGVRGTGILRRTA